MQKSSGNCNACMQMAVIKPRWGLWEHEVLVPWSWLNWERLRKLAKDVIYGLPSVALIQLFYSSPNSDSTSKRHLFTKWCLAGGRVSQLPTCCRFPIRCSLPALGYALNWSPPKGRPGLFLGRAGKLNSTGSLIVTKTDAVLAPWCFQTSRRQTSTHDYTNA